MPDLVHHYLDSAHRSLSGLGLGPDQVSDTTLGQNSVVVVESNWVVLTQTPKAGAHLDGSSVVHLGVVKLTDPKAQGITPEG